MKFSYKRLNELGSVSRGRSKHRPRNAPELYGGPYPFVQTADVKKAGLYLTEYSQTYSEKGLAQSKLWPKGTLCITIAANIADTAILGVDACFPDSVIGFISDDSKSNVKYVKYLFDCTLQTEFKKFSQGAAQDNLSQEKLLSIKFPVPDIECQNRIVAILSDYDSAIDNARRQIALLEEAAMRLYREWFDGTGKGWKRTPVVLADVLERLGTGLNPRKNFTLGHGENFYVTIKNMANNRVYLDSKCDKVDDEAIRKINRRSDLRKGDVLFSGIGTIGRAYLIAEAPKNWNTSESVFNLRANSRITPEFLYMLMLSSKMQQYAMNNATGCAQKGIRAAALRAYQFDLAPLIEIEKFTEQVRPMLNAVNDLNKKIDSLTEARDRLLPKLMSGEIEV